MEKLKKITNSLETKLDPQIKKPTENKAWDNKTKFEYNLFLYRENKRYMGEYYERFNDRK